MKINLLISVDLNDDERAAAGKNIGNFCRHHLKLEGLNRSQYEILSVRDIGNFTVSDFGLPEPLCRCLYRYGVFSVSDITGMRLAEINGMLSRHFDIAYCRKYISEIKRLLGKYELTFSADEVAGKRLADCGFKPSMIFNMGREGIVYLEDIALFSRDYIMSVPGAGTVTMAFTDDKLKENGLWYAEYEKISDLV